MGTQRLQGTAVGRRVLLKGAIAGVGAACWVMHEEGAAGAPGSKPTGHTATDRIVTRRVGPLEVLALLDAHGPFPGRRQDHFTGADAMAWEQAERLDPAAFGPNDTWELDFRCYAIRRPSGRVTVVDTGIGPAGSPAAGWAPVPGHLPAVLAAAGINADDVDTVVLTHLHEDHYGWAVSPTGTPLFPEARHIVQHTEVAALAGNDTAMTYVVDPLRKAGLLHTINGRHQILRHPSRAAVTAIPTPGHTPGHQSVLVDSGRDQVVVTGDVLVHAVQLADPDVTYRFEHDKNTARRTRHELLAAARRRHSLLATAHLNRPFVRAT